MKNILTIFKKEWDRVIRDKRLVITVMLLPGLMIYLIYSFIGVAIQNQATQTISNIAIVNPTVAFRDIYSAYEQSDLINVITINDSDFATYQQKVDAGDWDLVIKFDPLLESYDTTGTKPTVVIYSNLIQQNSLAVYSRFIGYLNAYEKQLSFQLYGDSRAFIIDDQQYQYDQNQASRQTISSLLPMLVIMFLFSGALSIGPESIAGEKERNTISTLLITPVKRSEIAIGKIMSLSVLSLISAVSSFVGILLSLPKLFGQSVFSFSIYSFVEYLEVLMVLFSTVLVIVGMISILSAFSRSVKEATTIIMPFYIVTILVSITSLFSSGASSSYFMYLLPIYNSVQTLSAILNSETLAPVYLLITVIANLGYLFLFVFTLNRMFNSEKIMFSK